MNTIYKTLSVMCTLALLLPLPKCINVWVSEQFFSIFLSISEHLLFLQSISLFPYALLIFFVHQLKFIILFLNLLLTLFSCWWNNLFSKISKCYCWEPSQLCSLITYQCFSIKIVNVFVTVSRSGKCSVNFYQKKIIDYNNFNINKWL